MKTFSFALVALLAVGCTASSDDTGAKTDDLDGDGYSVEDGDCDDADDTVNPGAEEVWYDTVDQDCDGNNDDQDGDGYAVADDCDDTSSAVFPGAEEVCDGVDNDCDGTADLGATDGEVAYADADGDGYGTDSNFAVVCDVGEGWSSEAGDCDDTQPTVYPGAEEICDDLDNDCDGSINEGNPDEVLYYRDADGDTFGDAADYLLSCATPSGYVADATDCDDASADVNPAAAELCDETDRNCDGDATAGATDAAAWYADADGDTYGDDATATWSCEAIEGLISVGGDCDDTMAEVNPAAVEVCNGADDDCSGAADDGLAFSDWYADMDGDTFGDADALLSACDTPDGYVMDATDCDDADALTYPGAEEVCDLEDNDCDGSVDDGATDERTYYDDADSDGYGDPDLTVTACGLPSGYAETGDDCDDGNSRINPGASEKCNGLDDDCDTEYDEDAVDATTYYADEDEDGYGDSATATASCDRISGYVTDGTDCDDTDDAASPAGIETCDGADNDCNGSVDDAATGTATWYADGDGDGYGDAAVSLEECSMPAGYVANADDCDDTDDRVSPADVEICNGVDDDCDSASDESGAVGETTWYLDGDSDGYGLDSSAMDACDMPVGYIDVGGDCDDGDNAVNPVATEVEDAVDNNCDGTVDEGFTPTIGVGDIIISEITRQPRFGASAVNTNGQWFEVYNTTSADIDLSDWYFTRSSSAYPRDGFYIDPAEGVVVPAGGYAVLCKYDTYTAAMSSYSTLVCDYVWGDSSLSSSSSGTYYDNTFTLQRDTDTLSVYYGGSSTTGTLIDEVTWTYDATSGYWPRDATRSMSLDPAYLDDTSNDDIGAWCSTTNTSTYRWWYVSGTNAEYGTPGSANYDCP
jgi:hypothetical protein